MPLKEEFNKERIKLKTMSPKDKVWYISTYYKFHIAAFLIILWLAISFGNILYANSFNTIFSCIIINSTSTGPTSLSYLDQEFGSYLSLTKKEKILVESGLTVSNDNVVSEMGYASMAKISALFSSQDLDVMIMDYETAQYFADAGALSNLDIFLPNDLKTQLAPFFVNLPDASGKDYPFAISLSSTPFQEKTGLSLDPPLLSIVSNTPHQETSVRFLRYLFQE